MTKETNFQHPPGKHPAILAYDAVNDRWQAVHVDASGNLQVDANVDLSSLLAELQQKLETADLLLDAGKRLGTNLYGWDGAAARKLSLLWGYSDRWAERVENTNLSAGTQTIQSAVVTTGYVYVLSFVAYRTVSASCTTMILQAHDGSQQYEWEAQTPPATAKWYNVAGAIPLRAGDRVQLTGANFTAGDDLYLSLFGYKMQVDQ